VSDQLLRRDALDIFRCALRAVDPVECVRRHLQVRGGNLVAGKRRYPLSRFRRVIVIGAGKAGATMARSVETVLGRRVEGGLVNIKDGHTANVHRVELNECGHPLPDHRGVDGARRIAALAAEAAADDLVICLISGGGSALLPLPADPITLEEKQETTRLLLACGATIHEINAVRKHISAIKGGQLARLCAPATLITLLLSDVVGDPLDVIGSGPTAPDPSTFTEAQAVLDRYGLGARVPASVLERIAAGVLGNIPETPKAGDPAFQRTQNLIVGSNRLAIDAAAERARALEYRPFVLSTTMQGETRVVAGVHAEMVREIRNSGRPVKAPACLISGGETTVTLHGDGLGGRNQEFVLAAAIAIEGLTGVLAFSAGTDGTDGPTDAAGAFAVGSTVARARELGLDPGDYLNRNDSYHFFDALGSLITTGPTGTNVMDVRLFLIR
jgi:glycerate 2-kinase